MLILAQNSSMFIVLGLVGGLALFLLGMNIMTESLTAVAGDRLRDLLSKLTGNRITATISGTVITGITQSSSVTTVLLVGFVSAGLMNASQCMGVIIGANIGSTFTAQLIAFNITAYAPLLLAAGVFTQMIARRQRVRHYAGVVLGLGLVFTGMAFMSEATYPLRDDPHFVAWMKSMEVAAFGVLLGALFTAVIQSSAATTGLVIVLATQGFITLEAGIALALGANVGTCVTAVLAAIGKSRAAWQVALMHMLFNVIGVVIWVGLIDQLADLVRAISPVSQELEGMERLAADAPRQIANAHTAFNVINAVVFLFVTGWMVKWVQWMLPLRAVEVDQGVKPKFISNQTLAVPSIALDYARLELERVCRRVGVMFEGLPVLVVSPRESEPQQTARRLRQETRQLYNEIVNYLGKLAQSDLDAYQSQRLHDLLSVGNHLQDLAEIISEDLATLGHERSHNEPFDPSRDIEQRFGQVHHRINEALSLITASLHSGETKPAEQVINMKDEIYNELDELGRHLASRLTSNEPNRLALYRTESDLREQLKRCYYLIRRMGKRLVN